MDKKIDVIFGVVIVSICIGMFLYGYRRGLVRGRAESIEIVTKPDTAYNKIILDSIKLRIIKKDSVIHELKYKMDYETKKVYTLNDSAAVELFYQLCAD